MLEKNKDKRNSAKTLIEIFLMDLLLDVFENIYFLDNILLIILIYKVTNIENKKRPVNSVKPLIQKEQSTGNWFLIFGLFNNCF